MTPSLLPDPHINRTEECQISKTDDTPASNTSTENFGFSVNLLATTFPEAPPILDDHQPAFCSRLIHATSDNYEVIFKTRKISDVLVDIGQGRRNNAR
jgi:hypothetical protein